MARIPYSSVVCSCACSVHINSPLPSVWREVRGWEREGERREGEGMQGEGREEGTYDDGKGLEMSVSKADCEGGHVFVILNT